MVRRLAATAAVTLCSLAGAGNAVAVTGDPPASADAASSVQLDAPAEAVVKVGPRLIIGGQFTYAGPYTGSAASLSVADGSRASGESLFSGGAVHAVIPDGSGGFFVGG